MIDDTALLFGSAPSHSGQMDEPAPTSASAVPAKSPTQQFAAAEDFIRNNLLQPINLSDIASAAGVNTRSLQRLFRRLKGVTPIKVLLDCRIEAARKIIENGDAMSVRELAARFHFANPGRFSKLYRETFACTPSQDIRLYRPVDAAEAD
ncbi:helix-turn-helix transcriptional regulator [Phyllobacterium sp. BT25]|uniref:Helix-turn-helix transcriptional regulator n=1 Tax=Phyllobacterium pellucidum TaxID=2740464 RepID=A0A849VYL5_9HYPH|nr:helix-turn-helix transcriptional regulator [Phyllobacterium pellucidum]NTS33000.1 helix-turn-helix transcriptional regulator [Phyllobacterium pellucidum]